MAANGRDQTPSPDQDASALVVEAPDGRDEAVRRTTEQLDEAASSLDEAASSLRRTASDARRSYLILLVVFVFVVLVFGVFLAYVAGSVIHVTWAQSATPPRGRLDLTVGLAVGTLLVIVGLFILVGADDADRSRNYLERELAETNARRRVVTALAVLMLGVLLLSGSMILGSNASDADSSAPSMTPKPSS